MAPSCLARFIFCQPCRSLKTIAVVGGGLMGSGIAQSTLQGGYKVHLIDSNEDTLVKSVSAINKKLLRAGEKKFPDREAEAKAFTDSLLSKLTASSNLTHAASQADLVIEAIVERLDAKHELFRQLDQCASPDCLFASNTSSLSLSEIGSVLSRKDRFGGLHFFNPVPVLKLVEVIQTSETSDDTCQALIQFARSLGKYPVVCRDSPGFIVNRLLVPYLIEAIKLVERGDASLAYVDVGMKLGAGYPMGPFELADFVGLDTIKFICDSFAKQLPGHPSLLCPPLLAQLVTDGKLGRKTGEGFYKYDEQGNKVVA